MITFATLQKTTLKHNLSPYLTNSITQNTSIWLTHTVEIYLQPESSQFEIKQNINLSTMIARIRPKLLWYLYLYSERYINVLFTSQYQVGFYHTILFSYKISQISHNNIHQVLGYFPEDKNKTFLFLFLLTSE